MEHSTLHPWPIVRGILLELSSYEVPKVVDRAGLKVDWALTVAKDYSDKMRIAAYRPRIDAAYDELSDDDQLRAVFVVAGELATRDLAEKLKGALETIGWRLEAGKLIPEAATVRELFFPKQSQHDAYVEIRKILQSAATSVSLIDPYVDQTLLTLLASVLKPGMVIRILTAKLPPDFTLEAKAWQAQHADVSLEVRTTREFHDRFIVIDEQVCWHIGCSIKDAGSRVCMLSNVEDDGNRSALLAQVQTSWQTAMPHQ
jgi:hypothetical protein